VRDLKEPPPIHNPTLFESVLDLAASVALTSGAAALGALAVRAAGKAFDGLLVPCKRNL
jgi:hypothetical protein